MEDLRDLLEDLSEWFNNRADCDGEMRSDGMIHYTPNDEGAFAVRVDEALRRFKLGPRASWTRRERDWYAQIERRAEWLDVKIKRNDVRDREVHEAHALRWALGVLSGTPYDAPSKARDLKP